MGRARKSFCAVRVNRTGHLYFDITWDRRWWEGTTWRDTAENRNKAEAYAKRIDKTIRDEEFNRDRYLGWFPNGTRAAEFRPIVEKPEIPREATVAGFFADWQLTLKPPKVRKRTASQYCSSIKCHVLPSLGCLRIADLRWETLATLQDELLAKGGGAPAINRALHHALRSMLRDAKRRGIRVATNLYDRQLWQRLPESPDTAPDPYAPEERDKILEYFRTKKPAWYAFVYFQFWQGTRPSEAIALRRRDVDLSKHTFYVRRSRVGGCEDKTKNRKSHRQPELHAGTVKVVRSAWPIGVTPDDYVFRTPTGAPVDEDNFYSRIWLPGLRALGLRERPFYNTRHSYISALISLGKKPGYVSGQTGHSIAMLERRYKKYFPAESDREIPGEDDPKLPGDLSVELPGRVSKAAS